MNRRLSLYLSLCLLTGLAAPADAKSDRKPVICGTVSDTEGRPLSRVVVSDGFTHAETNRAGRFRIVSPYPERVRFVSARIPSGYRPILKDGRSEFFAPVGEYTGKKRNANIVLEKDPAPSDSYTVLMIADPQANPYRKEFRSENFAYATTDIWKDLFMDMRGRIASTSGPCYGICLGDIAAAGRGAIPYEEVYKDYLQGMKTLQIPFFQVAGNHDHHFNNGAKDDDEAVKPFEDAFGPRNYSFDLGQVHYVVLDDCIYIKDLRRYPMKYGVEDGFLQWLKSDLARVPKDMPVMVCSHADLFNSEGVQDWVYDNIPSAYKLPELLATLQGFEKLYFWAGHTHVCSFLGKINSTDNPSGIETFVVGRSSGGEMGNEYVSRDGTPRGYVVLEIQGKEFHWKYHPLQVENATFRGKEKPSFEWKPKEMDENFQLRAYPRGAYGDDFIYANVFLWDPSWSIPVLRIGDKTYPMRQDYCYDLSYKEIVRHYNRTAGASASYSKLNPHSFLVRVPDEACGMGTVEVTDRFGNTWKANVSVDPVTYRDDRLHIAFDLREKNALDEAVERGYPLVLSGGVHVASSETEEGYWDLFRVGSSIALPALPGYNLRDVSVRPSGNTMRSQSSMVVTENGDPVSGGDNMVFSGNVTDTWELDGTQPHTRYKIVATQESFRISEIRLTYEKDLP